MRGEAQSKPRDFSNQLGERLRLLRVRTTGIAALFFFAWRFLDLGLGSLVLGGLSEKL